MNIPILKVPFDEEDRHTIARDIEAIIESGFLTMGQHTQRFEEDFQAFTGAKHAIAVNSGTAAIEVIIRALGIEGKSIVVPTNTFLATAFAVMHSGNRVIFADADPETFCLDPKDLSARIEEDTAAVVLVHIGGVITPAIKEIQDLCAERGIELIEDCAHAHGCKIDDKDAGTLGVAGAFSFFPTKVLTCGEGGMITTDDADLHKRALMIRNHGKNPDLGNKMSVNGYNWRLSETTAAIGVAQMRKAEAIVHQRQEVAAFYDGHVGEIRGLTPLKLGEGVSSSYYKYIVHLAGGLERDAIKQRMKETYQVSLTGEVYADLCHNEPIWDTYTPWGGRKDVSSSDTDNRVQKNGFPGSEHLSGRHICLPLYPGLSEPELQHVVDSLEKTVTELA